MKKIIHTLLVCVSLLTTSSAVEGLSIERLPSIKFKGPTTGLVRPEGVAFTPSGDLMAVANSDGNAITIYEREGNEGSHYKQTPSCVIESKEHLNYIHDLAFSPSGKLLAAVAREGHTMVMYEQNEEAPAIYGPNPLWVMQGEPSGLQYPSSVAFDKTGEWMAVCNRMGGTGVTLYKKIPESSGFFQASPTQSLSEEELLKYDLSAPHGLAFSPDGTALFVLHKKFFKNPNSHGESAVAVFGWNGKEINPEPILAVPYPNTCLHSGAFHPSGKYFAISNEKEDVTVFEWDYESSELIRHASVSVDREGRREGPKGVGFTRDGKYLVITSALDELLFYKVED